MEKLDICRNGEHFYGWQIVGKAFGCIDKDKLEYLKVEYERRNGSPTRELLEILSCKGKNVYNLIAVLKSPTVKRPELASLIEQEVIMNNRK